MEYKMNFNIRIHKVISLLFIRQHNITLPHTHIYYAGKMWKMTNCEFMNVAVAQPEYSFAESFENVLWISRFSN